MDVTDSRTQPSNFDVTVPEKTLEVTETPNRQIPQNRILQWNQSAKSNGAELPLRGPGNIRIVELRQFVDHRSGQCPIVQKKLILNLAAFQRHC